MVCENLIQFDVESINSNITTKYEMLQFIDQHNYEEMKTKYSVEFPQYFSGSYDQFKLQRNELTKLFLAAGYANQQTSSYRRTLSPASAEAYGRCMAENSHKPISAWIGKSTEDKIAITLRNGLHEDVDYDVIGAKPIGPYGVLPEGGTQVLMFEYNQAKDFMVAFNGIGRSTGTADTALVQVDKVRQFEVRKSQKEMTSTFTCGAGCHDDRAGCRIFTDAVFVADQDYYLLLDSRKVLQVEVIGGPGLMSYEMQWIDDSADGTRPRRLIAHPVNMVGNSVDTQGIIQGVCSVIAEREYLVEVVPERATPVLAVVPKAA
jgi:hypothetical protein